MEITTGTVVGAPTTASYERASKDYRKLKKNKERIVANEMMEYSCNFKEWVLVAGLFMGALDSTTFPLIKNIDWLPKKHLSTI